MNDTPERPGRSGRNADFDTGIPGGENERVQVMRLMGREIALPRSRLLRVTLGVVLVLLGFVGFLPVLGFWMIPLGLLVLSYDIPAIRRLRRRLSVWWGKRKNKASRNGRGNSSGNESAS